MKKSLQLWGALVAFAAVSATVSAQSQPANQADDKTSPQERKGKAESSLVGVSLYDTGLKIVTKFGTPDDITAISLGGGGAAGGGGAPGGGGGSVGAPVGASRGGGGGGRGGAGTATPPPSLFNIPVDDKDPLPGFVGDPFLMRGQLPPPEGAAAGGGGGAASTPPPGGGGGGGRGASSGAGGAAPSGSADRVTVTRWSYNMGNKRYAFILDKFNRVVQIEAIGLPNKSVKTGRGVMLGCPFSQLIKLYGAPDGYEISGNTIVVRYLVYDRVAFRLQRLKADANHQVTGIVVAAGKT